MGAGAGGLSVETLDRMAAEGCAFAESAAKDAEGKRGGGCRPGPAALAASLQKFVRMRRVGVPPGAVLQQLSLREDITDDMVRSFVSWCDARPGVNFSKSDVCAALGQRATVQLSNLDTATLQKFVRMRRAGVPHGAVLQQVSLRGDITEETVHSFASWCEARPSIGISREDVFAAFPHFAAPELSGQDDYGSKSSAASSGQEDDEQLLRQHFAHDVKLLDKFDTGERRLLAAAFRLSGGINPWVYLSDHYAADLTASLLKARNHPQGCTANDLQDIAQEWIDSRDRDPTEKVAGKYIMHAMVGPLRKQERRRRRREEREYAKQADADAAAAAAATKVGGR